MTAEIAILNRSALALAADSAVTLGTGTQITKIYDSAEKIFELSRKQPLALMIYNNAQFMNVPLDVLVRHFRQTETSEKEFKKVIDVWPVFKKFLCDFKRSDEDEHVHLQQLVGTELRQLHEMVLKRLSSQLQASGRARQKAMSGPDSFIWAAKERKKLADAAPLSGYLAGKTIQDFKGRYGKVIEIAANASQRFGIFGIAFEKGVLEELYQLIFAIVKSSRRTAASTGIVIGGFGTDEIFPTIRHLEMDGLYFGELRVVLDKTIDIDRQGVKSEVVPFAQKDMAERFMSGIDQTFEQHLERMVDQIVGQIVADRPRTYRGGAADSTRAAALKAFKAGVAAHKKNAKVRLDGLVSHMSKREIAEMAHSLVELTSHKRRFSDEAETVGGPIDVAILTKNEGFIWIRRKHYFERELNPNYFARAHKGDQS